MARPLRIEYPGAYYHVTARGNERKAIFRDDQNREKFLELLGRGERKQGQVLFGLLPKLEIFRARSIDS